MSTAPNIADRVQDAPASAPSECSEAVLAACPFCAFGNDPATQAGHVLARRRDSLRLMHWIERADHPCLSIHCMVCGAEGPMAATAEKASWLWNHRRPSALTDKSLDRPAVPCGCVVCRVAQTMKDDAAQPQNNQIQEGEASPGMPG